MLHEYLTQKNIAFTQRLVDEDEQAKAEMMKVSEEYLAVPFTYIQKDDGTTQNIIGFNKRQLEEVFG